MNLHIATAGRGPNLVLLHGWGMRGNVWQTVGGELERHFRVHRVDLPGHGNSGMCAPYTLERFVELLSAALPTATAVCGWSLGSQLALRWATLAPRQVKRLILVAATPCFIRRAGWEHGVEAAVFEDFTRDLTDDPLAALRRFIALQAHGDVAARDIVRELRRQCCAMPPPVALGAGLNLLRETDLRAQLDSIGQPTLIMHGTHDAVTPPAAGAWLAQTLPNVRSTLIPGAAHIPFLSAPRAFVERVVEFCNER